MIYSNNCRLRVVSGGKITSMVILQWQPTLTNHDPNPPIVLETPSAVSYTLSCSLASYSLSGTSSDLKYGYLISNSAGSYTFSGQDSDLQYVQTKSGHTNLLLMGIG